MDRIQHFVYKVKRLHKRLGCEWFYFSTCVDQEGNQKKKACQDEKTPQREQIIPKESAVKKAKRNDTGDHDTDLDKEINGKGFQRKADFLFSGVTDDTDMPD